MSPSRRLTPLFFFASAALLSGGCASIVHGPSQDVSVTSQPTGATVSVSNGTTVVTPAVLHLQRGTDYTLTITKAGMATQVIQLKGEVAGWFWGNAPLLLLGILPGLVGGAVDFATGAAYELRPENVVVVLSPAIELPKASDLLDASPTGDAKLVLLNDLKANGLVDSATYDTFRQKLADEARK
jgi:hypothetical protein